MKHIACLLLVAAATTACKDDPEFLTTDVGPEMTAVTVDASARYGMTLQFSATLEDRLPLSTLKAQLYFDDEMVAEEVIRTKDNGAYSGEVTVPYYKNMPDGEATLRLIAQNTRFGTTSSDHTVAMSYPTPERLIFRFDGRSYEMMPTTTAGTYAVTDEFPRKPEGYIEMPGVGADAEPIVTFGYDATTNQVVTGSTRQIPFFNIGEGECTLTFNIRTFEFGPVAEPADIRINGTAMEQIDANNYQLDLELTQGGQVAFTGDDVFEPAWIDDNYFSVDGQNVTFIPVSGRYRISLNVETRFVRCKRINADGSDVTLSADGTGGLWLMAWGIGAPSQDYQFGWEGNNFGSVYCMPEFEPKKYRITGKAGPEVGSSIGDYFRFDYISAKYFYQRGWGGEMRSPQFSPGTESWLRLDGTNLALVTGVELAVGATYELIIDLSGGTGEGQGVISFRQVGDAPEPDPEDGLQINGTAMELSGVTYQLDMDLTQGETLTFSGGSLFEPAWINPDYYEPVSATSVKFVPMPGKYRIQINTAARTIDALPLNADGTGVATLDDQGHGAVWFTGYGYGSPTLAQEPGWDTSKSVSVPEFAPGIYKTTGQGGKDGSTTLGQRIKIWGWSGKFYKTNNWGGLGRFTLAPGTEAFFSIAGDGNIEMAKNPDGTNVNLEEGATYELTLDLTGGNDNPVVSLVKK